MWKFGEKKRIFDTAGIRNHFLPGRILVDIPFALPQLHLHIIIIITLLLLTAIEFSLVGNSPYTSTDKTYEGRTESHEQLFLYSNWE